MFSMVMAHDNLYGIGRDNIIPWYNPQDMKLFKKLTMSKENNAIVMGFNTWKSLNMKPLPKRTNIVISRSHNNCSGALVYKSINDFVQNTDPNIHYWIIGGAQIYTEFLKNNLINDMYITHIDGAFGCDVTMNYLKYLYFKVKKESDVNINDIPVGNPNCTIKSVRHIEIRNNEEHALLGVISDILQTGSKRMERTGTGTIAKFGGQLTFDLNSFPLMTSRPHSLRLIFEELMWILRGQRDVKILENKDIHIWSPNASQEFIDKQNLAIDLEQGDIGESYGYNMRHFNGGFDQLANVIDLLNNNPYSRRIIISLWNPDGVNKAALPPCLCWYQFFVRKIDGIKILDCQAMNRSSDILVAGGWNVATAALLTYILAAATGMKSGKLSWIYGDAHVYINNIDAAKELINREPNIYPKLFITKKINTIADIEGLEFTDLKLINYNPVKPQIKVTMNV
jgi:thymidylate synthase